MILSYKKLFTITLEHDYFGDAEFTGFSIVPSDECIRFFKNAGILFKSIGNTFIALIEEDEGEAKRTISSDIVFRLYIKFTDPFFANVTNLNYNPKLRERLYFSNNANNEVSPNLYLTQAIEEHDTTTIYNPGTIVKEFSTNKIFECIATTTDVPVVLLTDSTCWVEKDQTAYATSADIVNVKDTNYTFTSTTEEEFFRIRFFAFNTLTNDYDILAKPDETKYVKPDKTTQVSISMAGLKPGRYKIEVNGVGEEIYYDPFLVQNKLDGVIEIYNNLEDTNSYSLFDADDKIKETAYNIVLNNKRSIWKYVTANSFLDQITDSTGEFNFVANAAKSEFLSDKPIPLVHAPQHNFILGFTASSPPALKDLKARSPSISIIKKEGNYFYSNINLSY